MPKAFALAPIGVEKVQSADNKAPAFKVISLTALTSVNRKIGLTGVSICTNLVSVSYTHLTLPTKA